MQFGQIKRREFITLLRGAAAAARGQYQAERMRRIGVLMNLAADDAEVTGLHRGVWDGDRGALSPSMHEQARARIRQARVLNTDQGSQFTGAAFTSALVGHGRQRTPHRPFSDRPRRDAPL